MGGICPRLRKEGREKNKITEFKDETQPENCFSLQENLSPDVTSTTPSLRLPLASAGKACSKSEVEGGQSCSDEETPRAKIDQTLHEEKPRIDFAQLLLDVQDTQAEFQDFIDANSEQSAANFVNKKGENVLAVYLRCAKKKIILCELIYFFY